MSQHERSGGRPGAGFTIIEIGLILAVLGVLVSGVIVMAGFISSSKVGSAIQMVNTIQNAAREYAKRKNYSLNFNGVTKATLQAEHLLPDPFESPFDTAVSITPEGIPADRIRIQFSVPKREACIDLRAAVSTMAQWISPDCKAATPAICDGGCNVIINTQ